MLKSRDRTEEISVMEMEEWPQVVSYKRNQVNKIRITGMTKKGRPPDGGDALCQERKR